MTAELAAAKGPIWQFVKFCVVGLFNTFVGYAAILSAAFWLGFGPYAANAFGYSIGLLVSFALHRRYTFASRQAILPGLSRFLLAFAPSYGLNLLVLHLGVQQLAVPEYLAQAAAITAYTLAFFLLCRFFVFSPDPTPEACYENGRSRHSPQAASPQPPSQGGTT